MPGKKCTWLVSFVFTLFTNLLHQLLLSSLVHEWGFKFADLILLQWYPKRSIRYVFWKKLSIKIFRAKIEGRVRERHRDTLLREFLFTLPSLFLSAESSPLLLFPFPFWRGGKLLSIRFSVLRLNNASHKILHRS